MSSILSFLKNCCCFLGGQKFGYKKFLKMFSQISGKDFGELYVQLCDKFQGTDNLGTFGILSDKNKMNIY